MEKLRPQKCRPFDKKRDSHFWAGEDKNVVAEIKRNGHRIFMSQEGVYSATWIQQLNIPRMQELIPKRTTLDGEICFDDYSKQPGDVAHALAHGITDATEIRFRIFDILEYEGEDVRHLPFAKRRVILEDVFGHFSETDPIVLNEVYIEKFDELRETLKDGGAEGIVFKYLDRPYAAGSKCNFIKYKFTRTADIVITSANGKCSEWRVRPGAEDTNGVIQPDGVHTEPWLRGDVNLMYGWYDKTTGELREVGRLGFTGPKEELEKHIGKVGEIKVWGVFPSGCLQHPQWQRWRTPDDKPAEQCIFDFENGVEV